MWVPFVDSIKLFMQGSVFAAYYNVVGNIIVVYAIDFLQCLLYGKEKGHLVHLWYGFWTTFAIEFILSFTQESAISTTFSVMF